MYFSLCLHFMRSGKFLENQIDCKYIVALPFNKVEYYLIVHLLHIQAYIEPPTRSRKSHSFAMLARLWSVIDTTNIHGSAFMK